MSQDEESCIMKRVIHCFTIRENFPKEISAVGTIRWTSLPSKYQCPHDDPFVSLRYIMPPCPHARRGLDELVLKRDVP